jgi:hypothetical protein
VAKRRSVLRHASVAASQLLGGWAAVDRQIALRFHVVVRETRSVRLMSAHEIRVRLGGVSRQRVYQITSGRTSRNRCPLMVFPCRGRPERRMKLFGDAESVIRHRYWLAEGIATPGC